MLNPTMNLWGLYLLKLFKQKQKKRKVCLLTEFDLGIFGVFIPNSVFFLVLEFEDLYLDNLPNVEMYERSFMHRDIVTHLVTTK